MEAAGPRTDPTAKLLSIADRLDRAGVLDRIDRALQDPRGLELLERIASSGAGLRLLDGLSEWGGRFGGDPSSERLLQSLIAPEGVQALSRMVELMVVLDRRGLLEPIAGLLSDTASFTALSRLLFNDTWIGLAGESDRLMEALKEWNPSSVAGLIRTMAEVGKNGPALGRLLELFSALDRRGLIDPMIGLLEDESAMSTLLRLGSTDQFARFLKHGPRLFDLALGVADIDEELSMLKSAMKSDTFRRFLNSLKDAGTTDPKPVRGLLGAIHELKDPDVAVGVSLIFHLMRELGRQYTPRLGGTPPALPAPSPGAPQPSP